ncbi:MAG: STAS domain-containing protein [Proteobacteria bacterium]|nr:STAS domain-containing protein [Pseudomonadota bacterium]
MGDFTLEGSQGRYRLSGVADMSSARALLERGYAEFHGQPKIEVDLAGLTGADSAGLAVLLAWISRAHASHQALRFTGLPATLAALARVCGVEAMLGSAAATA